MKHRIIAAIAPIALIAAVAVPAHASTGVATPAQMTAFIKKAYAKEWRAATAHSKAKYISSTVTDCKATGGGHWTCQGTYTIEMQGLYMKNGQVISITGTSWQAVAGKLLKVWPA